MKMRKIILTIVIGVNCFRGFSQSDPTGFNLMDYPSDVYEVDSNVSLIGRSKIILIEAKNNQESYTGPKIWLQQMIQDSLVHNRYLGQVEDGYGFYLPSKQPSQDHFLLVECKEYNGNVHVINSTGEWFQLPGYYFATDNNHLYTKAVGDGDLEVSKVNLETGKIEKKIWNNVNGDDPWEGNHDYNYQNNNWIK